MMISILLVFLVNEDVLKKKLGDVQEKEEKSVMKLAVFPNWTGHFRVFRTDLLHKRIDSLK